MSLEYTDDNELVYQAKAAAKDIVNAKYEVTKKVGDFLFLAHSEEEFYQRATAVDNILDSTSSRRLASVSDSKAKLVKALYQEWEIKHASCDACDPVNFNLPERVASPVLPETKKSKKLWDRWSILSKNKTTGQSERRSPFEGNNPKTGKPYTPFQRDATKLGLLDQAIGGSLGRLDDPEVMKQVKPGSAVWIDPYGLYGPDKQRVSNSLKGRKPNPEAINPSEIRSMMGIVQGRQSLGSNGVFTTYHKCTGNTFRGFNKSDNSFPKCQHEHHEGDGCGLTSEVAEEGSMQPGCATHHILTKVLNPSLYSIKSEDGTPRIGAVPHIEDEQEKDVSGLSAAERQQRINRIRETGQTADDYTNVTEEQVGEIPPSRMFLMHPDQSARVMQEHNTIHQDSGGTGPHPATLDEFTIGGRTHRVGDIVSTMRSWGNNEPRTERQLGIVIGASSHRNGQYVRLGRSEGFAPNTEGDSSMSASQPGEYSVMIHRLDSHTTGKSNTTAVDPDSGKILSGVNETTQYYPSSHIETVEPFSAKSIGKGGKISKLYSALKGAQARFNAKSETPRQVGRPKTVKPTRDNLDLSTMDLSSFFDDSDE